MLSTDIVRYLALVALLATTAWMTLEPGWDSVIGFIVVLGTFIGLDVYKKVPTGVKADRELLSRFLELLPSSLVAGHLAEVDMAYGHRPNTLEPFFAFVGGWKGPEFQFNQRAVQQGFSKLRNAVSEFVHYLAENTFPLQKDLQGIPPEWELDNPERYTRTANELNRLADLVAQEYGSFVTLAKKKLDE